MHRRPGTPIVTRYRCASFAQVVALSRSGTRSPIGEGRGHGLRGIRVMSDNSLLPPQRRESVPATLQTASGYLVTPEERPQGSGFNDFLSVMRRRAPLMSFVFIAV